MAVIYKDNITAPPDIPKARRKDRPNNYKVVYRQNTTLISLTSVEILSEVFNMNQDQAKSQAEKSISKGWAVLFVGCRDVAETKTERANAVKQTRQKDDPILQYVSFACEPL